VSDEHPGAADEDVRRTGATAATEPRRSAGVTVKRRTALLVLGALCLQFAVLGAVEAWRDSPTIDEPLYIASGVTALTRHQFRFNIETGPLPKVLGALPVLLAHPVIPNGASWAKGDGQAFTTEFVQAQVRTGKLRRILFLARSVSILEGLLVGVVIYALAAGLFGRVAGLVGAGLWLTTGYVLGMTHVVGIDVPNALFSLVGCLCLSRYLRHPSWRGAGLVGLAGGLALLTRATGLLLVGALVIGVVAGDFRHLRQALVRGAMVLAIAWASVWGGVRLLAPSPAPVMTTSAFCFPQPSTAQDVLAPVPWPVEYERAFDFHFACSNRPGAGFLFGRYWEGARWWYWPGSMLVKLPVSVLAVMALGLLSWFTLDRVTAGRALLAVGLPALIDTTFTLQVPRPQGLRYLLPSIALAMVAGSAFVRVVRRSRLVLPLVGVLAVVQLSLLVDAVPNSLSWTTPPFRPGYRTVTEADLDWGQNFYGLQRWARGKNAFIAYYGPFIGRLPSSRPLLGTDPRRIRGWVAVSASLLTRDNREPLSWLRAYCPVSTLDGSILVYRFERPPDPAPGPVAPPGLCAGEISHRT